MTSAGLSVRPRDNESPKYTQTALNRSGTCLRTQSAARTSWCRQSTCSVIWENLLSAQTIARCRTRCLICWSQLHSYQLYRHIQFLGVSGANAPLLFLVYRRFVFVAFESVKCVVMGSLSSRTCQCISTQIYRAWLMPPLGFLCRYMTA
jgi:hypothetical protein